MRIMIDFSETSYTQFLNFETKAKEKRLTLYKGVMNLRKISLILSLNIFINDVIRLPTGKWN